MIPIDLSANVIRPVQYKMLDKKKCFSNYAKDFEPEINAATAEESEKMIMKETLNGEISKSDKKEKIPENKNPRMWIHRIDLKNYDPQDVDVKIENAQDEKSVTVSAGKMKEGNSEKCLEMKRTVYIPNKVDASQITSYMDESGAMVIQAPLFPKLNDSCQKSPLKRKHSSIEEKNKMPNVREDFQRRTESSFEDDDTDSNSSKKCRLNSDMERIECPEVNTESRKPLAFSVESLLGKDRSTQEKEHSENVVREQDTVCDDSKISVDCQITESETDKCQITEPDNLVKDTSDSMVCTTTEVGSTILLSIPTKSFFPEEDKVSISLNDHTLSFKALRKMKVAGGELSETFLKEFTFPSSLDTKTLRLVRDKRGNVIICISRKSS
ncbi:hypothetical protein FSP39_008302 [Pinctada imbricata]|uniref:SHSP domain-containing protein n=1 Tax=Pinctada imbricata TaxID=66713 RepID=A0AA88YHV6_PINIB|nr:hypothetical protein FSP39_008302 [Pinctada imbricata]